MPKPLLAVDAPSLLYRAFYALPKSITDDRGQPVNALLGMVNSILFVVERHDPRAVVLCYGEESAHYRVALYPPYHAARPPVPDELQPQFEQSAEFFGAFGWVTVSHDQLEADDLLGSLAAAEVEAGGEALILTGDRDMFQTASDRVTVLYVRTGAKGPDVVTPQEVRRRYGIDPELVPDFIALRGDPSDGLPGAPGIGEKTARDLLRTHGSLEGAIANALRERPRVSQALREGAEELRRFREIATLRRVDVEPPPDLPTNFTEGAQMALSRGMKRLAQRLERAGAD